MADQCVMSERFQSVAPEKWSSCSVNQLRNSLTRADNNLGRCLANEPITTVADPVCGNGIREHDEICDCGSPEECNDHCCNARTCKPVTGAQCTKGECCTSTCQFKDSRTTVQHAEVKVGSVTLRNTAVGSLQSVRQMCTSEMEQHATMARPTASLESARLTTNSASTTLEPVSIMQFQPGSVCCNSKSMCSHCKATHTPTVFTLLISDNLRGTMYNLLL